MKKTSIHNILTLGWLLFLRDMQWRYRLTFLGYFWAILRPLFVGIPIIVVGRRFNLAGEIAASGNYEIYAFSGMIFFRIFFDAIEFPQTVIWRARTILKQIKIPCGAVVIASCFHVILNLCIYIFLLVVAIILFGTSLQSTALLAFGSFPFLILAGLSLGILFAPFALFYLDIRYGLGVLSGLLMWLTPIFYTMQTEGAIGFFNKWNPLTHLVNVPRYWLIGGAAHDSSYFFASLAFFLVLFCVALRFYRRALPMAIEGAI